LCGARCHSHWDLASALVGQASSNGPRWHPFYWSFRFFAGYDLEPFRECPEQRVGELPQPPILTGLECLQTIVLNIPGLRSLRDRSLPRFPGDHGQLFRSGVVVLTAFGRCPPARSYRECPFLRGAFVAPRSPWALQRQTSNRFRGACTRAGSHGQHPCFRPRQLARRLRPR